jgi:hypothetical protein
MAEAGHMSLMRTVLGLSERGKQARLLGWDLDDR